MGDMSVEQYEENRNRQRKEQDAAEQQRRDDANAALNKAENDRQAFYQAQDEAYYKQQSGEATNESIGQAELAGAHLATGFFGAPGKVADMALTAGELTTNAAGYASGALLGKENGFSAASLMGAGTMGVYNSINTPDGNQWMHDQWTDAQVQDDLRAEASNPTQDFGFHSASPDPNGGLAEQASPYGSLESVGTASPDASSAFGAPGDYGSYGSVDAGVSNGVGTIGPDSAGAFSSYGMNSFGDSGAATSDAGSQASGADDHGFHTASPDGGASGGQSTGESGSSQGNDGGSSGGSDGGGGGGGGGD